MVLKTKRIHVKPRLGMKSSNLIAFILSLFYFTGAKQNQVLQYYIGRFIFSFYSEKSLSLVYFFILFWIRSTVCFYHYFTYILNRASVAKIGDRYYNGMVTLLKNVLYLSSKFLIKQPIYRRLTNTTVYCSRLCVVVGILHCSFCVPHLPDVINWMFL